MAVVRCLHAREKWVDGASIPQSNVQTTQRLTPVLLPIDASLPAACLLFITAPRTDEEWAHFRVPFLKQ